MPLDVVPVFVSSTSLDLGPERSAAEAVVHGLRETKFVGMEHFGSRDETTRRASLDEVDRSELYVGIFAARYGSGITEEEYRRASARGLPCLIYFKSDAAALPPDQQETDAGKSARLATLKQELRAAHIVKQFKSPEDLAAQLATDLHRWLFDNYLTPKLHSALRGEIPHTEAQALLDAVKDLSSLGRDLLARLRGAGFNLASGERSAAVSGNDNLAVTGDSNVVVEHAGGDVNVIHEAPRPIIPTLHQLRAPVGDFVGREKEIAELLATLRGGGSAAITGISGMGGIGKTELSLYVAERLRDAYPDAQLVVDMRGTDDPPRDPSDALASCIRAFLGLEYKTPDNLDDLTRLYRSTLQGKRALILLDNARDSAQVRPFLPPSGSALLITSRNAVTLPGMRTRVTLDQLQANEARELLTDIAPRVPADVADQVCYLCGYLPLAVRAAGSLLDVTVDLDPSDYAAQLADERTRLELIGAEGVDLGVEASFGLSYARLTPDAARVFRQLAVFPATFDAKAEEAVCHDPGHRHLSELLRRNLVLYNPDTRRYRLHDLARLFARPLTGDTEWTHGRIRYATHYLRVLEKCENLYLQGREGVKSGLALFDAERRNVEAGQRWSCEHSGEYQAATRLCNMYPGAGVNVLHLRQPPRESILWHGAALAAARRLNDRGDEGRHLGRLALGYLAMGEVRRAIETYEQVLSIAGELGDPRLKGGALGGLGIAHANLGEPRRAIEFFEQERAIVVKTGDRRAAARVLGNMGTAYRESGEPRRAIELQEQRLAISREVGDRVSEGEALCNLGAAYNDLGEVHRTLEFNEQYLAIARDIGDRRGEGTALLNLCLTLGRLGERERAVTHAEAALEIFEQLESPKAEVVRAQLAAWRGEATAGE